MIKVRFALPDIEIVPETIEISEPTLEPLYRVLIHNDDVTPMDFVVSILERIFFVNGPDALKIMFTAHFRGMAYVQTLPKSEAQSRVAKAHFAAGLEGYPLHFSIEPE
jgi:ATP-dependent Clp protease adaptor protein ClpS